jgi:hypothetical protein
LDLLERILECSKHKIALATVAEATEFFTIGHWVEAKCENLDIIEAYHDDKVTDEATKKFGGKDFIICPINDAYPVGVLANLEFRAVSRILGHVMPSLEDIDVTKASGSHWSVVIIDCRQPRLDQLTKLKGHYLDSIDTKPNLNQTNRVVAYHVIQGIRSTLNEHIYQYIEDIECSSTVPKSR